MRLDLEYRRVIAAAPAVVFDQTNWNVPVPIVISTLAAAVGRAAQPALAFGAQPHMTESITLLQSARGELAQATPNKGGHRERALTRAGRDELLRHARELELGRCIGLGAHRCLHGIRRC